MSLLHFRESRDKIFQYKSRQSRTNEYEYLWFGKLEFNIQNQCFLICISTFLNIAFHYKIHSNDISYNPTNLFMRQLNFVDKWLFFYAIPFYNVCLILTWNGKNYFENQTYDN